jgi:DNA-binding helix-turn-helix protein
MKKQKKVFSNEFIQNMQSLGKSIRINRETKQMTIEQLAYQSNISVSYICQVEMGRKNITYYTLWCISKALNVSIGQLLNEKETLIS